jgi:hypothetical protein
VIVNKLRSTAMSKKTYKFILVLVALLFANIEAAHAGLIQKFKLYIHHEFSNFQILFSMSIIFFFGLLIFIITTPVTIGKEKLIWLGSYTFKKETFNSRRKFIAKTDLILSKKN